MLTNNEIKFITSLQQKKYRKDHQLFIIEGEKILREVLYSDYEIESIYATEAFLEQADAEILETLDAAFVVKVKYDQLKRLSLMETPPQVLSIVKMQANTIDLNNWDTGFILALDGIQDAGNLGTLIRTADWFGIKGILCSENCVELYNPKTIQATMGSIFRVKVDTVDLKDTLKSLKKAYQTPIFGTTTKGQSLYQTKFEGKGIVLLGNEGKGISDGLMPFIDTQISIPRLGQAESLNVAIAGSIICAHIANPK